MSCNISASKQHTSQNKHRRGNLDVGRLDGGGVLSGRGKEVAVESSNAEDKIVRPHASRNQC